jgi:hypothetical protein
VGRSPRTAADALVGLFSRVLEQPDQGGRRGRGRHPTFRLLLVAAAFALGVMFEISLTFHTRQFYDFASGPGDSRRNRRDLLTESGTVSPSD